MISLFNSNKQLTVFKYLAIPTISVLSLFLSGCVGLESKFDCNVDSGGRCAPMHHINQMANYGFFNNEKKPYRVKGAAALEDTQYVKINNESKPLRSNEKIQQIWIGPYEDSNGNYHEGENVYTVIKKGGWVHPATQ